MKNNQNILKYFMYFSCCVLAIAAIAAIVGTFTVPFWPESKILTGITAIAVIAITAIAVYHWWLLFEAKDIVESFKQNTSASRSLKTSTLLAPLNRAIEELMTEHNRKTKYYEKMFSEQAIEIGLLEKQKYNTEAIIYSIRDAVIVIDSSDRLTVANEAACKLFDFQFDPEVAQNVSRLIKEPDFLELLERSKNARVSHVKHEVTFQRNAQSKIFDCIISCIEDNQQKISGIVAVLHDITKEKEISQMKNDFVSHVSHELKTPLASINAYAEMLVDGEAQDTESISQFCTIIQDQAQRLNRLIEDILNISRIESGLVKVSKDNISVSMLIQNAVQMIKSYAAEKNITMNEPTPILFDQVYADKDMISQVIINLLSNAVKYTQQNGQIDIQLDVDEADNIVKVAVTDTGVGIPTEDAEHVFDKFYRVKQNDKYAKGTGLGLNLVKQIVEKVHSGKMYLKSEVGKGSTFTFELPLAGKPETQPVT